MNDLSNPTPDNQPSELKASGFRNLIGEFFNRNFKNAVFVALAALSVFLICAAFALISQPKQPVSSGYQRVLVGRGEASIDAIPNLASFNFTVRFNDRLAKTAQSKTTELANSALKILETKGVNKKDIKTERFATYPNYEFQQSTCENNYCPPPKRVLKGYESLQTISVRIRDFAQDFALAGELLNQISEIGILEIEGLNFEIEDERKLKEQALAQAIDNAKENAKNTANALGVGLKRIVSFNENGQSPAPYQRFGAMAKMAMASEMADSAPEISAGSRKISSSVSISYEFE
jgi:uncharacterized protein YggE